MYRRNPTIDEVKEVAERMRTRGDLFRQATELRGQYFLNKFQGLPSELQELFLDTRDVYLSTLDIETNRDPLLTRYYRKAAKRFHPDATQSDEKRPLFEAATDAYQGGNLPTLQSIVLIELADNFDRLSDEDRTFLTSEFNTMVDVAENLWREGWETAVTAADLERMSLPQFQQGIEASIKHMQDELRKKGSVETPQRPSLLEGR